MLFWNCFGRDDCCNPYSNTEVAPAGDVVVVEVEDAEEEDLWDGSIEDKYINLTLRRNVDVEDFFNSIDWMKSGPKE